MNARRCYAEEALEIDLGRATVDVAICVDKRQILTLQSGEPMPEHFGFYRRRL